ncbi:MAG: carbamoyl-phosphate synthase small subunit [Acidobacteria bacterium]|nr:MAG: carbamoyl-phosphate synthase small subunit [Acidobacteriota bacterium]RPJ75463.1 MAG: carbamoyl-phosphate synthase small subunit [Acidobacteriota bacterium]
MALEDGTCFQGVACGADGVTSGEVVFNTSMTGYQEILTDPSYHGQIVTMTCPEMGNYGVSPFDVESRGPRVAGFIVRQVSPIASNWRAGSTLPAYLAEHGIVAIAGLDTRALTRRLRSSGVMRGVIATGDWSRAELVERARHAPSMEGADLVREVTCPEPFEYGGDGLAPGAPRPGGDRLNSDPGFVLPVPGESARTRAPLVAAYDYGMKWNILRRFAAHGCRVRVFPAAAPASEIRAASPDGVFLSNGPGDPAALPWVVENVRQLIAADLPVFGICLGHQILALALGARTFKLKFGHRGGNHPVKDLESGRVEITSQNHGFAVDALSLSPDLVVTHQSLYDGTIEGIRHRERPVFSVQYHPEASPGPHDADYLFARFVSMLTRDH